MRISTAVLQKAVRIASGFAMPRSTLPILGMLRLEWRDGFLTIGATDLGMGVIVYAQCETENESESLCVPADVFGDFIKQLGDETIALERNEGKLRVISGGHKANFQTMLAEGFPTLHRDRDRLGNNVDLVFSPDGTLLLPQENIDAIQSVVNAASRNESRPALTAVNVSKNGEGTVWAATDGFRLATTHVEGITDELNLNIPTVFLLSLFKTLKAAPPIGGEEVSLYLKDNAIMACYDDRHLGVDITSSLLMVKYPDYTAIMPDHSKTTVNVDAEELRHALMVARIFTGEYSTVQMTVEMGKDKITVVSESADRGSTENDVPVLIASGDGITINLNVGYVLDAIQGVTGKLTLKFTGPTRPMEIVGGPAYHLVMPMYPPPR